MWLIVREGTGEIWRIDPDSHVVSIIQHIGRHPLDLAVAADAVATIRTAPTISSSLAVGAGAVWVAVAD